MVSITQFKRLVGKSEFLVCGGGWVSTRAWGLRLEQIDGLAVPDPNVLVLVLSGMFPKADVKTVSESALEILEEKPIENAPVYRRTNLLVEPVDLGKWGPARVFVTDDDRFVLFLERYVRELGLTEAQPTKRRGQFVFPGGTIMQFFSYEEKDRDLLQRALKHA